MSNFTPFTHGSKNQQQKPTQKFNYGAVPPPLALTTATGRGSSSGTKPKSSYTSMDAIAQYTIPPQNYGSKKRSTIPDDDYFLDDDDEQNEPNLDYIPAEGSPTADKQQSDSDEDPLDAFMAGLEKAESKTMPTIATASTSAPPQSKGVRADIDDMDDEESYYKYMEDNPMAGVIEENSGDELEYDADGNPIAPSRKRYIDPLPQIDHSEIDYKPFEKNFYVVHDEIAALNRTSINELRHKLGIKVTGAAAPAPVCSFAHFGFDDQLMKSIRKNEYVSVSWIFFYLIPDTSLISPFFSQRQSKRKLFQ